MNLSISPIKTPQFKANTAKIKYNDIKNIPNVPCACCGQKVIIAEQLSKLFSIISRPLTSMLKMGVFNKWQEQGNILNVLQEFANEHPDRSLLGILQEDDNYFRLKSAIMDIVFEELSDTPEDIEDARKTIFQTIVGESRSKLRTSAVVMRHASQYKKYLDGIPLEVFEQLEIYAQKYPRKTLTEIINMDEVYKFHRMKNLLQRTETREKSDFHFQNIQNIINSKQIQPQEIFDELKEQALEIFATISDSKIRMAKIKELYQKFLTEHHCQSIIPKVNKEIDALPTTYLTKDSYFVHAHDNHYDDNNILTFIFTPFVSTFEHVIPRSKDGEDEMANGLVMHKKCNLYRRNMSYDEFFTYHPDMPKNIQKQVGYIAQRIINGSLGEMFRFWPMNISRTLYRYTNGVVNLNLTKHCERGLELTDIRINERKQSIAELNRERDDKISKKLELQSQIKALESEMEEINDSVDGLKKEINEEKPLISSYTSYLKIKRKQKK